MDDQQIVERINELAHQEHELWESESRGEANETERERLKELQVTLDPVSYTHLTLPTN